MENKTTYLHLVIPSQENDEESTSSYKNTMIQKKGSYNKKVYYEVGCKVMELNKIYK